MERYELAFDPAAERWSRERIEAMQLEKFRRMASAILPDNAFYARKLQEARVDPLTVDSMRAFARLPFTTRIDLLEDQELHPPYGSNLTYPIERYSRLHQTSGTTTGRPLRWLDTPQSWEWVLHLWRPIYAAAQLTPSDRLFFPFSFGPFLGFWAGFEGAARLGNLTLAGGGMTTEARLKFLLDNRATIVCCTPTYALRLAETAHESGIDLASSEVRALIVAGEPGGSVPAVKARIEAGWGARCLDHTGMTEIASLGYECIDEPGQVYLTETECIAEVIDPETGDALEGDADGELVLTNLGRWGSPLIRYRTGDSVRLRRGGGKGGRNFARMDGGILGRRDDMVIVKGNNVYPSGLDAIVRRFVEVAEYRAEVWRGAGMARLRLEIEPKSQGPGEGERLCAKIRDAIRASLLFNPEVVAAAPGSLPRYEMKARRFTIRDE